MSLQGRVRRCYERSVLKREDMRSGRVRKSVLTREDERSVLTREDMRSVYTRVG